MKDGSQNMGQFAHRERAISRYFTGIPVDPVGHVLIFAKKMPTRDGQICLLDQMVNNIYVYENHLFSKV